MGPWLVWETRHINYTKKYMSGTLSSMGSQNRMSSVWVAKPLKIDGTQAGLSVMKYFGQLEAWTNMGGGVAGNLWFWQHEVNNLMKPGDSWEVVE